ncbi:MAG: hypothetical protein IKD62_01740, partial [Oscillospiraceae bacterium]|nr:hypothetical protein [Oscillospiraceae bacterium]
MKKLIAVFLLAILVFAFAACESEQEAVQYLQRMIENAEKDSEDAESWTGKEDPEAEPDPVVVPDEPLGSGSRYIPQISDLTPLKPTSVEAGEIIDACRSWSTLLDKEGTPGDRVVFFYDGTGAYMEKPLEAFAGNTERSIRWTYDEDYGILIITAGKESWSYSFFEADGTIMLMNNSVDSQNFKGPAYFMQDEEIIYTEPKGKADGNYSGFYVSANDSSVKILIHGDGTITLE